MAKTEEEEMALTTGDKLLIAGIIVAIGICGYCLFCVMPSWGAVHTWGCYEGSGDASGLPRCGIAAVPNIWWHYLVISLLLTEVAYILGIKYGVCDTKGKPKASWTDYKATAIMLGFGLGAMVTVAIDGCLTFGSSVVPVVGGAVTSVIKLITDVGLPVGAIALFFILNWAVYKRMTKTNKRKKNGKEKKEGS